MFFQLLERRGLLSLTVSVDYTFDLTGFFTDPERRAVLQAAVDAAVDAYGDALDPIVPGGGNSWAAVIDHPGNGGVVEIPNPTVPADTLILYVGARNMSSLAIGGPGGFNSTGSTAWNQLVATRGEANARGGGARDFGPFGGTIAFDSDPTAGWYFGLDETAIGGGNDFFATALHEMTHVLGFGTSDSWESQTAALTFRGPASVAEYDGDGNVPIDADRAHWASGTADEGRETAMDPALTTGTRKLLTPLDTAAMDDIGWEIPLVAQLSANPATNGGGEAATFNVTYSHYTNIGLSTLGDGDVSVVGPNGFSQPAKLVDVIPNNRSAEVVYSFTPPGGSFDEADNGSYSVVVAGEAVGDGFGNFAPAGPVGSFPVNVDRPPTASLSAEDVTALGGTGQTLTVTYSDSTGIDESTIGTDDLSVARESDGKTLAVVGVSTSSGDASSSSRNVIYTLAAPSGSWTTPDNGTYAVTLNPDQVRDNGGTAAESAVLGTFRVAVGTLAFAAGQSATFFDADGDAVTVSLKGQGSGQVLFDSLGMANASGVLLRDTNMSSALSISATGNGTSVGEVGIEGPLRSFTGKGTDVTATVTVAGAISKLQLRNVSGTMTLNGVGDAATSVVITGARDLSLNSAGAIGVIKVKDWLDTDDTPDVISAPHLSVVSVKGTFQAGITANAIDRITIGGVLEGSEIRVAERIGSISVGSISRSHVFAGVRPEVDSLPDSEDDFSTGTSAIQTFRVKSRLATAFSDTSVAAASLGRVALSNVESGNASSAFGVAASVAASVTGSTAAGGAFRLFGLNEATESIAVEDFAVRIF